MSRSACVTNQNLSVPRALTFSPGFFSRVVRASSLRTSGFSEICSAVSGINYESHQSASMSATFLLAGGGRINRNLRSALNLALPLVFDRYAVFTQERNTSATLHASAMH